MPTHLSPLPRLLLALAGMLILTPLPAATVSGPDAAGLIRVETDLLRLTVDPAHGGRISSLVYAPVGKETVFRGGGFCLDHFWEQPWPGEFLGAAYQVQTDQPAPDTIRITATRTATGQWGTTPAAPMAGLVLTRTMLLRDGHPEISVEVSVANPTAATKMFGYWAQQVFTPAGQLDGVTYFRPGALGVNRQQEQRALLGTAAGPDICYVKNPVAGWTATVDPTAHAGYTCLMDYNELAWLYNCVGMNTTEWMYQRAVLPPGKTWTTAYTLVPFTGLDSVAHASRRALVSIAPVEKPDALDLTFSAVRSAAPVEQVTLSGEVENLITHAVVPIPPHALGPLTDHPQSYTFTRPGPLLQQVVVRVKLAFPDAVENFEWFYGGKLGYSGQNMRLDLSPIYVLPAPARQRHYIKPDTIALVPHPGFNVVWGQGMFYDKYGLDAALARLPAGDVTECLPYSGLLSEGLENFPLAYDQLLRQDVIVLTDVAAASLDDNMAEMVKDYVQAGGGLVVCGGPWSLGKGQYAGSKLGALLPVETVGKGDFRTVDAPLQCAPGDALLGALDWTRDPPRCYVLQEVRPRPGAQVRVTCGQYPVVVTGQVGQGRVAVIALTPLGDPPAGERPWWRWRQWPDALAKILNWTAGK